MMVRPLFLFLTVASLLTLSMMLSIQRWRAAERDVAHSESLLMASAHDVERILELRQRRQTISEHRRPEQDVIARVNEVLDRASLPASHFASVRQDSDAVLHRQANGPTYRRQQVRLSLAAMTVMDLGAFLEMWLDTQPLWTPVRVDLSHLRGQTDPPRFDTTIVLATTYVAYE